MPLSMDRLRSETLAHLGLDDASDLDPAEGSTILDLLINRSWWDLLDRFEFKEKEQEGTFLTVAGTRDYLIQTIIGSQIFEALQQISILDPNTYQHTVLKQISRAEYEDNYNEQTTAQAQPTNWFPYNAYIRFNPVPDQVYTLTAYWKYILDDLTAGNPNIPQAWHESILYGAVSRGHLRARDYNSARYMQQQQSIEEAKRSTTLAKEDKENKFAGVNVLRNPYSLNH